MSMRSSDHLGEEHYDYSRQPAIRTIAMPADTNPAGDIFGGWLMAQMDLAAGNAAALRARRRCVTVAVEAITFHNSVKVGDEVTVFADLIKSGRTSMHFKVQAWRRRRDELDHQMVTQAVFVFVALNPDGKPTALLPG